jgi:hypothetical protein
MLEWIVQNQWASEFSHRLYSPDTLMRTTRKFAGVTVSSEM